MLNLRERLDRIEPFIHCTNIYRALTTCQVFSVPDTKINDFCHPVVHHLELLIKDLEWRNKATRILKKGVTHLSEEQGGVGSTQQNLIPKGRGLVWVVPRPRGPEQRLAPRSHSNTWGSAGGGSAGGGSAGGSLPFRGTAWKLRKHM